ncbi:MAG: hypothetical protein D6709_01415 [Chloroflexi bacterium]|nr:MAG: hypothetical protein D6709_01415 [Chloroflexota bacterium]
MGAIIPILILNNLTRPLGAPVAYVIAALVPVAYVLADTFLISRRFNAIATYVALTAIMNGVLAFWFVDGWRYALKDTAGLIGAVVLFFGSIAIGKPMFQFFIAQVLQPDTPKKDSAWRSLIAKPKVRRGLVTATALVGGMNAALGVANFLLNANIVTAPFGTDTFNSQVAGVNAITRVAFTLASLVVFAAAFYLAYRALFQELPSEEGKSQFESEFWDLVRLAEQRTDAQTAGKAAE